MRRINYFKFKRDLEGVGKTYFTIHDLRKFYPYRDNSLQSLLSRWVRQKLIIHLGRGYYTFNLTAVDYLRLACNVIRPSYVSFEYALHYYHLIDQIPQTVTLASQNRHKFIKMGAHTFEYTALKPDFMFGFVPEKGAYIAEPEKALVDLIYLVARGKRLTDLSSLQKSRLKKTKIKKYLKKFPRYVRVKATQMLCAIVLVVHAGFLW